MKNTNSKRNKNQLFYAFSCDKRMDYYADIYKSVHIKNGSVDSIIYGVHDTNGGCVCEMRMVWYVLDGKECPRLEVFSDYFGEMINTWHAKVLLQIKLLGKTDFTADEFSRILIELGFEDKSDVKLV